MSVGRRLLHAALGALIGAGFAMGICLWRGALEWPWVGVGAVLGAGLGAAFGTKFLDLVDWVAGIV